MKKTRRKFNAAFKTKVVLEPMKENAQQVLIMLISTQKERPKKIY
jgi:hypothetical protein